MQKVFFSDISQIPYNKNIKVLCKERQDYIDRIQDTLRKRQSLFVWKLLEYVFCSYYSISGAVFFEDKSGKWVSDRTDFFFSLSHSYNIVAVIISDCKYIGIDVEKVTERVFKVAKYVLDKEIAGGNSEDFDSLIKKETVESLTLKWAEKESRYKSGKCNLYNTNCFIYDDEKNKYCLSVASEEKGIELKKINMKELMDDVYGDT